MEERELIERLVEGTIEKRTIELKQRTYEELKEENITLREQIRTYYRPENELNKHKYEILQERINKAIEYMNNYNELVIPAANIKSLVLKEEYKKIISMLQGEDK